MTPHDFERWVGARFRDLGYKVRETGKSGDHGVDLDAVRAGEKIVIQCKRYRNTAVDEPAIRDLYGALQHESASRAYLVTTGYFTAAATLTSSTKLRASRLAPPINPPSMSRCASSSGAFAGFIEPP